LFSQIKDLILGLKNKLMKKEIKNKKTSESMKGNKNAVGNEGGRPPFFLSPEDLQEKIEEYFNGGAHKKTFVTALGVTVEIPIITICGLAYFLGFESRQSLTDYEEKSEFSYIIKRARLRIEMNYEENLTEKNATGSIFALKNMDWKDKSETDITTKGDKISNEIDYSKLSTATLIELSNAATKSPEK
jgi:hypothetical protein